MASQTLPPFPPFPPLFYLVCTCLMFSVRPCHCTYLFFVFVFLKLLPLPDLPSCFPSPPFSLSSQVTSSRQLHWDPACARCP